jgi:hypothetical protein
MITITSTIVNPERNRKGRIVLICTTIGFTAQPPMVSQASVSSRSEERETGLTGSLRAGWQSLPFWSSFPHPVNPVHPVKTLWDCGKKDELVSPFRNNPKIQISKRIRPSIYGAGEAMPNEQ